jgi:hypothetical protein
MRVLLLALAGVVGRQIKRKFQEQHDATDGHRGPDAKPTAAPFEAHVEGDAVHYEPANPTARDPDDPDEPFGGQPLR